MSQNAKIFVAGHTGLVGSAVLRRLQGLGYNNILLRTSKELDLTQQDKVEEFFQFERPEYVFLCAAKVGGILANKMFPAQFIQQNLLIQTHVLHEAMKSKVKRLLFLGSSCIYPRECPQPIKEEYLLTGLLEATNRPYAIAKIAGIEMCSSYNRQYGTRYVCAMPTNLYGPNDHYDLETCHVLPALIRKFHDANEEKKEFVELWGTGKARREFLHSDDLANAVTYIMNLDDRKYDNLLEKQPPIINVGCGEDLTIQELAEQIKSIIGFQGKIHWNTEKPDGTPQKLFDISLISSIGWKPQIALEQGICDTYSQVKESWVLNSVKS